MRKFRLELVGYAVKSSHLFIGVNMLISLFLILIIFVLLEKYLAYKSKYTSLLKRYVQLESSFLAQYSKAFHNRNNNEED